VAGNYSLTAKAMDNWGATATSAAIMISVTNSSASPVTLVRSTWNGNDFSFSFLSQSGHSYDAEYTDSLGSGSWQLLTTIAGDGSMLTVTNHNVAAAHRFYRVETK
jgi:hypothetical protein